MIKLSLIAKPFSILGVQLSMETVSDAYDNIWQKAYLPALNANSSEGIQVLHIPERRQAYRSGCSRSRTGTWMAQFSAVPESKIT